MRGLLLGVAATVLLVSTGARASAPEVVGAWRLNRELTVMPEAREGQRPEGRPPGGGGRGGGMPGGGMPGGRGGFGGAMGGPGGGRPSEKELHKMEVVRRRMTEIPDRLIITRAGDSVTITDGDGRSATLKTDGKKQDRLTGDGEFTSKTHFDGSRLIVEEDFDGPKVTTTFTPVLDGGEIPRLEVTVKVDGMKGGPGGPRGGGGDHGDAGGHSGPPEIKRVYDLEAR